MGIRDRIVVLFNGSLAAIFVAGSLLFLIWALMILGSQVAGYYHTQEWISVPVNDLLRPANLPAADNWAHWFVPALGMLAENPDSLVTWSFAQQALGWFGRLPFGACALAVGTVMAWISSDLRVENMRVRARSRVRVYEDEGQHTTIAAGQVA